MATATATRRRTTKAAKPAPPPEPEVVEEDEDLEDEEVEVDEVEELEEDEVQDSPNKRAASAKKRAQSAVTFGISHLAEYLSTETGKNITTRELRQLARKLARDDSGRVKRDIVAGNRSRYDWPDINHPEVQAIISAYHGGELEADKKAKLDALKASKAAKVAAKKAAVVEEDEEETPAPAPKRRGRPAGSTNKKRTVTKKPEPVVEEDDEELEIDDDE